MAQAITPSMSEGRRQALERRRAQALKGRAIPSARPAGAQSVARPSAAAAGGQPPAQAAKSAPPQKSQQMQRSTPAASSTGRAASVARRQAMTSRGKVGIAMRSDAERTRAETARARPIERKADKDDCGCGGRKEAKEVGGVGVPASNGGMSSSIARPASKVKAATPRRNIGQPEGRQMSKARRRMLAEKGRTALSQTDRARSPAARARHLNPDLNGRELAREVRSERSRSGDRGRKSRAPSGRQRPAAGGAEDAPWKVGSSQPAQGQTVTGTQVGRGQRLPGDELSSCRVITGTEYLAADIFREFCQTYMVPTPSKVSLTKTAAGLPVTGTEVGRSTKVTGNEAGNCTRVTGDEPGTRKTVTGTPYAGTEIYREYCAPGAGDTAPARGRAGRTMPGMPLVGLQQGIGGKMTGERKGANEAITGPSYGQDQFAQSGGGLGAVPGNPDFPQSLDGTPWAATFSVSTPAREAQRARRLSSVTGTRYEQGHITGPFVMGEGKITGTEDFRFGGPERAAPVAPSAAPMSAGEGPTGL